ncbi:hypothetical protein [Buchnera aphidicola]|uniref:hypothetical protein n=1 Tax=Buchnera aphidicola TaxID=9 RepID=UPI0031B6C635
MKTLTYEDFNTIQKIKNFLPQKNDQLKNLKEISSQIQTLFINIFLNSVKNSNINLNPQINLDTTSKFYKDLYMNYLSNKFNQKDIGFLQLIKQQIL